MKTLSYWPWSGLLCSVTTVGIVSVGLMACGPQTTSLFDEGPDAGPVQEVGVLDAPLSMESSVSETGAPPCMSDRECGARGLVCDRVQGQCVECVSARDCAGGQACLRSRCVAVTPCTTSRVCPGQVCGATTGYCVDCNEDGDCAPSERCEANTCVPRPRPCTSSRQCTDLGLVCDLSQNGCVECVGANDCAEGTLCRGGRCLRRVCAPGEGDCVDATARRVCSNDGTGYERVLCTGNSVCREGVCRARVCAPESAECVDATTRRVCSADGTVWESAPCASNEACDGGACVTRVCVPGASECVGTSQRRVCEPSGLRFAARSCASGERCVLGECTRVVCAPESAECVDATTRRVCNADGTAQTTVTCALGQSCSLGMCVARVCVPGASECVSSSVRRVCDTSGLTFTSQSCASGQQCIGAGICATLLCAPGSADCADATTRRVCNADGTAQTSVACGLGQVCSGGACMARVCVSGSAECADATTRRVCNADGLGFTVSPCSSGACIGGECRVRVCLPGEASCADATTRRVCNTDGFGYTSTACPAGQSCAGAGVCAARSTNFTMLGYAPGGGNTKRACVSTSDGGGDSWRCGTFGPADSSVDFSGRIRAANGRYWMGTADRGLWSSPDGSTWTRVTTLAHNYRDVAYGAGQYVAVTTEATVSTSVDGITWVERVLPFDALTVRRSSSAWVLTPSAIGERRLIVSTDGSVFSATDVGFTADSGPPTQLTACADGVLYAARMQNSAGQLLTSADGIRWRQVVPISGFFAGVLSDNIECHGTTLFTYGDDTGYTPFQRHSTDGGRTWTRQLPYTGYDPTRPFPRVSAYDSIANRMVIIGGVYGDNPRVECANAYFRTMGLTGPLLTERIPSRPFSERTANVVGVASLNE